MLDIEKEEFRAWSNEAIINGNKAFFTNFI